MGLATDPAGNVYVADNRNHAIRMIRTNGTVVTLAGNGTPGKQDGPVAQARFDSPVGVCLDSKGAVYVADSNSQVIRKIDRGVVSSIDFKTELGGGVPSGIAVDAQDRLVVYDWINDGVACQLPADGFEWLAGNWRDYGYADGEGMAAYFEGPSGGLDGVVT